MEITIKIPGIEQLTQAIEKLAAAKTFVPEHGNGIPANPIPAVGAPNPTAYAPQPMATVQNVPVAPGTIGTPNHTQAPSQNAPSTPMTSPSNHVPQQTPNASVPVNVSTAPTATPPTYTIDVLSAAAAPLMAQGRQAELVNLLNSFGVQALTMLPPERFGDFATALRGLGAKI